MAGHNVSLTDTAYAIAQEINLARVSITPASGAVLFIAELTVSDEPSSFGAYTVVVTGDGGSMRVQTVIAISFSPMP